MPSSFVSVDWLSDHLGDPAVHIVDVREPWEYQSIGHVPGAVNVPFERVREAGGEDHGMLPGASAFAELLAEVGIETGDSIVAYDDTHGVFAARFLVTAELYGHPPERRHLLDGDINGWQLAEPLEHDQPAVERARYRATLDPEGPLVEMSTVREAIDDPAAVIVDTRNEQEYLAGHIPGAVRLDWRTLLDEGSRGLRATPELRELLADEGIDEDRRVLLYCNTARRISHTYLVLRELGYPRVGFYEGSLTEWEANGGPLERG